MPKLMLFVCRKSGLTHEQFRHHYETVHAPLARSHLSHLVEYVRNYASPLADLPEPLYDCVTEFWFDNEAGLAETIAWTRSAAGKVLAEDEERFMDRSSMRIIVVEEAGQSAK